MCLPSSIHLLQGIPQQQASRVIPNSCVLTVKMAHHSSTSLLSVHSFSSCHCELLERSFGCDVMDTCYLEVFRQPKTNEWNLTKSASCCKFALTCNANSMKITSFSAREQQSLLFKVWITPTSHCVKCLSWTKPFRIMTWGLPIIFSLLIMNNTFHKMCIVYHFLDSEWASEKDLLSQKSFLI